MALNIDIIDIPTQDEASTDISYGLTEEQTEALTFAYGMGYFDEPREVSLIEIVDEMGLSSTAVSSRLCRGTKNLIAVELVDDAH